MAIPGGLLIPVLKVGASIGRIFGEAVNLYWMPVLPGAFAIAVSLTDFHFHLIQNLN